MGHPREEHGLDVRPGRIKRRGEGEHPNGAPDIVEFSRARHAAANVALDHRDLRRLQRAERVRRDEVDDVTSWIGRLAHASSISLPPRASRSFWMPSRIRVLIVPSGSPSRSAISRWVRPWK